jgi:hypothetical protein
MTGRAWKVAATLWAGGCFKGWAASGPTAVMGSNVFTQTAGLWHESAVLADPSGLTDQAFAWSIAISGHTAAVAWGNSGRRAVYLYRL